MKPGDIEDLYRLSPMQEGMLFHHLYSPQSDIYFRQQSYTFHGPLNVPAFTRAWERVIERHAVLRASFFWQDLDKPVQMVSRKVATPLEHQDWRGLSEAEQDERLKALLSAEHDRSFDITRAPLMRIVLVQVADEVSHFIWSYHHLLMDGWSKYHVLREVVALYDAFCEGRDLQLGRPRPYRDYISWLKQQDKSAAEAFWRDALKDFIVPTPIGGSAQGDGTPNAESEYAEREVWLTAEATAALKTLAKQHQFTLNTLMQGAWSLLLSRYSGEEDVLFGITVSGRPASLPGVESMVGLFINTLPLRVRVPHDEDSCRGSRSFKRNRQTSFSSNTARSPTCTAGAKCRAGSCCSRAFSCSTTSRLTRTCARTGTAVHTAGLGREKQLSADSRRLCGRAFDVAHSLRHAALRVCCDRAHAGPLAELAPRDG